MRLALGTYAALVPDKLLLANPNDHPTDQMTLRGVRFAVIEELPEAGRLNTQRLKKIVGTGAITARKMKQDFVTFEPQHALFVTTNHLPIISETDHGTWRRLDRVPFKRRYRPAGVKDGSPMDQALHQRVLVTSARGRLRWRRWWNTPGVGTQTTS